MAKIENKTIEEVQKQYRSYLPEKDAKRVDEAYELAKERHKGQVRKSGEEYISHPIQVVSILVDLKMDADTLIAGFLHDIIEDTPESVSQVADHFGNDVAVIVEGVTKLNKVAYNTDQNQLAENHRKLLLAMSKDIRVIIVKLADRLHNMRTLDVHRPDKQKRIASETLEIYAPLAHRLGLATIKWELEDLSLRYIDHEAYKDIAKMMDSKREDRLNDVKQAINDIEDAIESLNIKHVEVTGRPKHIYSVYRKMHDKNKEFSEIYDLLAIRILVDSVADTYAVLGAIHAKWKPMPGRFKDYIALPKPNGYQSLHTTVIGPNGRPLEVQIRTFEMHEIAEFGIAAHWTYKQTKGSTQKAQVNNDDQRHLNVIQSILEFQDEAKDDAELFIDSVKTDLFSDRVYVFTPKGDVFELPEGSGPIDMAFLIHTDIGLHIVGAKVNGRIVPLEHVLKTGDIVEINTSPNAKASRDWMNIVKSRRARNKIRTYFRQQDRGENIEAGREILRKYLVENQLPNGPETFSEENLQKTADELSVGSADDILAMIGFGDLAVQKVAVKLTEATRLEEERKEAEQIQDDLFSGKEDAATTLTHQGNAKVKSEEDISIAGIDSLLIHLGKCCTPVPGDEIAGYITKGRGVSVHRVDCHNMKAAMESGERVIDVEWNNPEGNRPNYDADLTITGMNRDGLLADTIRLINANTHYLNAINGRVENEDTVVISVSVGVRNLDHLTHLMEGVKGVKDVYEVQRTFH